MEYFAICDENVATIFQLQWNIRNISYISLQYSVLCGYKYPQQWQRAYLDYFKNQNVLN